MSTKRKNTYRVDCYMYIEPDETETYDSRDEARKAQEHLECVHPENIYLIRKTEE